MDNKTAEKLNDATVRFANTLFRISDEGGYDRGVFLKAAAQMIAFLADREKDAKKEETT